MKTRRYSNTKARPLLARKVSSNNGLRREGINSQKRKVLRLQQLRSKTGHTLKGFIKGIGISVVLILIVGLLTAFANEVYKLAEKSEVLGIKEIRVTGLHYLDRQNILETCAIPLGSKLYHIPVKQCLSSLSELKWIKSAKVHRRFPSTFVIDIIEEEPLALGYNQSWFGLTPEGKFLPGISVSQQDLPIVERANQLDSNSLSRIAEILILGKEQHPFIYANLSQIRMRGQHEAEVFWRDGQFRVLINLDGDAGKMFSFLRQLFEKHGSELKKGHLIDLRYNGYAYVS